MLTFIAAKYEAVLRSTTGSRNFQDACTEFVLPSPSTAASLHGGIVKIRNPGMPDESQRSRIGQLRHASITATRQQCIYADILQRSLVAN
jgi:hypothetical protein